MVADVDGLLEEKASRNELFLFLDFITGADVDFSSRSFLSSTLDSTRLSLLLTEFLGLEGGVLEIGVLEIGLLISKVPNR